MRRWLLGFLPLIIVLLLAGYGVVWWKGMDTMQAALDDWIAEQEAYGLEAGYVSTRRSGFPGRLQLVAEGPYIHDPAQGLSWRGETLAAVTTPLALDRITFAPSGLQEITLDGETYQAEAETAFVQLSAGKDGLPGAAVVEVLGAEVWPQAGAREDGFTAERLTVRMQPAPLSEEALASDAVEDRLADIAILVGLENARAPADAEFSRLLGRDVRHGVVRAMIGKGQILLDGQSEGHLDAWRNIGGAVDLDTVDVAWGEARLQLTGDIKLDAARRPEGLITVTVEGGEQIAGALVDQGVLTADQGAMVAQAFLFAKQGGNAVSLPVGLRGGEVRLGMFPVGQVGAMY